MEKSVDTENLQIEKGTSKLHKIRKCEHCKTHHENEQEEKCKHSYNVFKVCKKVVSKSWSCDQERCVNDIKLKKMMECIIKSKINVLNSNLVENTRQSVVKKTKLIYKNVPDRLGKVKSKYSITSEAKLLLKDGNLKAKSESHECLKSNNLFDSSKKQTPENILSDGLKETKISDMGMRCSHDTKETADSLKCMFETNKESKNILKTFFDDCLNGNNGKVDASSQESDDLSCLNDCLGVCTDILVKSSLPCNNSKNTKGNEVLSKRSGRKKKVSSISSSLRKIKDQNSYNSNSSSNSNKKNMRHVCKYCQKTFKSNGKLNSHVYSHTGERPFDCSHCGKAFSSKFKLVRHLLIHTETRKFVCQICDRTFLRNDHLKNHYKVHDPKKKMYKCLKENCDKEYSSLLSHKKHMAYHNVEDGDLKCLICHVKYETKEEILFHLKLHSGSRLFKSQSDKKFKCEYCDRFFLTRKDVTRHLVVHTGERDFLCQFCPQRFGRKDHLVRHIKKSHGNVELSAKRETKTKKNCHEIEINTGEKNPNTSKSRPLDVSLTEKSNDYSDLTYSDSMNAAIKENTHSNLAIADRNGAKECTKDCKTTTTTTTTITTITSTTTTTIATSQFERTEKNNSFQTKSVNSEQKEKEASSPSKAKHSTTQILLQNIPNILIIPNNSIILLRNQIGGPKKDKKDNTQHGTRHAGPKAYVSGVQDQVRGAKEEPSLEQTPAPPDTLNGGLVENLTYESNVYQPQTQGFLAEPVDGTISTYDLSLAEFSQFATNFLEVDHPNLVGANQNQNLISNTCLEYNHILTSNETTSSIKMPGNNGTEGNAQATMERLECEKNTYCRDIEKEFFSPGHENLMVADSTSNLAKDEEASTLLLPITGQTNEHFELLRNLLTVENSLLSPLPGFSQIFHSST